MMNAVKEQPHGYRDRERGRADANEIASGCTATDSNAAKLGNADSMTGIDTDTCRLATDSTSESDENQLRKDEFHSHSTLTNPRGFNAALAELQNTPDEIADDYDMHHFLASNPADGKVDKFFPSNGFTNGGLIAHPLFVLASLVTVLTIVFVRIFVSRGVSRQSRSQAFAKKTAIRQAPATNKLPKLPRLEKVVTERACDRAIAESMGIIVSDLMTIDAMVAPGKTEGTQSFHADLEDWIVHRENFRGKLMPEENTSDSASTTNNDRSVDEITSKVQKIVMGNILKNFVNGSDAQIDVMVRICR